MFYFSSYLYQFVSIKYVNMLWHYHFNEEEKLSISKKMKWYAFICFYNHLRVCVCVCEEGGGYWLWPYLATIIRLSNFNETVTWMVPCEKILWISEY